MSKTKTSIADLVKTIDAELSSREVAVSDAELEIQQKRDQLAEEALKIEIDRETFQKEKADFEALRSDVDIKYAKIRSDQKLTEDLKAQAILAKEMEKMVKDAKEERGLSEYNLEQVAKREQAMSAREEQYKLEIQKQVVTGLFKG